MAQPLLGADHVGAGTRLARVGLADHPVAAHAGGEVDDDVGAAGADDVDGALEQFRVARALAGGRVTDVKVGGGGAGLGGVDGGLGDLLRRHGNVRVLAHRVTSPGDGTCHDDFEVHALTP